MNGENAALIKKMQKTVSKAHEKDAAFKKSYNTETAIILMFALIAALFLRAFVFQNTRVEGSSMYPTFFTDEQVFVEKLTYLVDEPKRGEVIICHYGDTSPAVIKRVIGLPGDTVSIYQGKVYINDLELDESAYWNDVILGDMDPVTVPEKHVFVMGDNRNASSDSRAVGPVPYYRIIGRARFVIWPLSNFGKFPQ